MASIDQLKQDIDLHDLAIKLGLKRGKGDNSNYHSPRHEDKTPSLSIFNGGRSWKDFSTDEGGSCIDLVMYVRGSDCDTADAIEELHDMYGYERDEFKTQNSAPKSQVEYIADRCMENPKLCTDYLLSKRKISQGVIDLCIKRKTLGFNDWTSPKIAKGSVGYGGKAPAFFTRCPTSNRVVGVDMRYLSPKDNGGLKTNSQGEKNGFLYIPDRSALIDAHTVYVVESPINALSVMTAFENQNRNAKKKTAAVALKGTNNKGVDWTLLKGKKVFVCMDNDEPNEKGYRPGPQAAWRIHEEMLAVNIGCLFVDQSDWEDLNDVNDYLIEKGESELRVALKKIEKWAIPGLVGKDEEGKSYNRRLFLPSHDYSKYWRFSVTADHTHFQKVSRNQDGEEIVVSEDVCGFRVASLSRISIQSTTATTTGESDAQPSRLFAASVQTPKDGSELQRKVLTDEQVHNIDQWRKFGAVFKPASMSRLINIWERAIHIGERKAVNFVGLAFKDGKPKVNNGSECYFTDPDKQCPYNNLTFHSGQTYHAKQIVAAYQATFKDNAAMMLLAWGLGAHLKVFLSFWPHMILQAEKGSGKSTILDRLQRTITFTMFSGQSVQTDFRLLTTLSHTCHPVGWEEISARAKIVIDKAVSLLQEAYGFSVTRRGADMLEYLIAAPVIMAGEDVPVESILGKAVRSDINERMGDMLPDDLPRWPMQQWLEYLAGYNKSKIRSLFEECRRALLQRSLADSRDKGADRIVSNYAAIGLAWRLICDFSGIDVNQGGFNPSLLAEMNLHIKETKAERQPWVWIMEIILGEIDANLMRYPYVFCEVQSDNNERELCLCIRPPHIMQHLSQNSQLRQKYDALPIKSPQALKKQLIRAGVVVKQDVERTINGKRNAHMIALSIKEMEQYGLTVGYGEFQEKPQQGDLAWKKTG